MVVVLLLISEKPASANQRLNSAFRDNIQTTTTIRLRMGPISPATRQIVSPTIRLQVFMHLRNSRTQKTSRPSQTKNAFPQNILRLFGLLSLYSAYELAQRPSSEAVRPRCRVFRCPVRSSRPTCVASPLLRLPVGGRYPCSHRRRDLGDLEDLRPHRGHPQPAVERR
jgi:hypothetical protein